MPKAQKIYRCDVHVHGMNAGKERRVRELLQRWRQVAVRVGAEQWRLFFETGALNARHYASPTAKDLIGGGHRDMIRHQVVGVLASWLSNRQNEMRDLIQGSNLDPDLKHQLHTLNRFKAWHRPGDVAMRDGTIIPLEVRRLARRLFQQVCRRHRRPNLSRINAIVDQRAVQISPAHERKAPSKTPFSLWAYLSTLDKGAPIWVPLVKNTHHQARQGQRVQALQINQGRDGRITFGVLKDIVEQLAVSRAAYVPRTEVIALDLGLKTLFATSDGNLLGRGWMARVEQLDRQITKLAAHRQSIGLRKVRSRRYVRLVQRLRGFITSETHRILNRLVQVHAPATIVVEHLRFQNPGLSRRMNRLLSIFGKAAIENKLQAHHETHGIDVQWIHAAYSSQACSACEYTAKNNRPEQAVFACRWCGHHSHADVNAARVLRHRRSVPELSNPLRHRREILEVLVRRHTQRFTRLRAGPADPRRTNPYFKAWLDEMTLTGHPGEGALSPSTGFAG